MHSARVLALLALFVKHVHLFSWDIVVGGDTQLEFYYNGTLTHTEVIPSAVQISSVTYDPVHYRVLFAYSYGSTASISSFDLSTRKTQRLVTITAYYVVRVVYDPVTQALYCMDYQSIYSLSLNPASSNQADGNHLITLDHYCSDLTVDSCGGYIYWITHYEIERTRLDGSERKVLIDSTVYVRLSLAIDQQTQKIYWTEKTHYSDDQWTIESANFNGENRITLHILRNINYAFSLAVSKDFIYWQNYKEKGIWQLPKYSSQTLARKLHSMNISSYCTTCHRIATNYTIKEQIQGIKSCDSLQGLIPNDSESESTVSVCQNYCFKGECSVSAEGQPTCSCKAGYSGERCEVNACHDYCLHGGICSLNEEGKPACQCTAGYDDERCDVSLCKEYCFQGNCSVGAEGQPKCSCKPGYAGERCEVNACINWCSNNGVCSLNETGEPACECTAGYDGERCDVSSCKDYCLKGNCSVGAEGQPKCSCMTGYSGERCEVSICKDYCFQGNCSVDAEGQLKCRCMTGYSGERCEENACHKHCLNGGVCSLNEEDEPACQCTAGYNGGRCEVSANKDNSCDNSGEGTVSACHQFCLNDGTCSLNEATEPVCQCKADYAGERCDVPSFIAKWVLHAYKNVPLVTLSDAVKSA